MRVNRDDCQNLIHVPGEWFCPVCLFETHKRLLSAADGSVVVNNIDITETCPNDGSPLERVTWKQRAEEAERFAKRLMKEKEELQAKYNAYQELVDGAN